MIGRPYDRPDLDQARYAPALYVTGALISGKPMLAYEGRLQIHNAIGACTAEQIDGDTLPNGSAIYVDQTTSEVVVAWPPYTETGASQLTNPGFEAGNLTGWDVTTIGQQGTPPNHVGVTTSRPYAGSYCSHYAGQKGFGHAGGIEAQWLNTKRAACYPQKKISAAIKVSFDDTSSSQNRGRARLVFFDAGGNPIRTYDGNLIKGNSEAWQDSSLTQAAPEGTRSVGMGAWVTSNQSGAVRLDAATWDAPDIVGTAVDGVYNLTIRVRDSAGRIVLWSGSITVASQTFLSTLLSYNPIFVLRLAEASGPTALNAAGGVNGAYSGGISPGSTALYSGGGTSAAMTATSGRAEYPGSGMASTPVGMTIGVIASLADITNIHMLLNRDDGVGGSTRYWQFRTNQTNLEFIDVLGSGTTVSFAHGKAPNSPALFIARYNATTGAVTLSVNGTVLGSGTTTTGLNYGTPGGTSVCVGNYSGSTFDAAQAGDKYSEAFLIPSVLTDAQVAALASAAGF